MWQADPSLLCKNHLLAEHREGHMIAGTLASPKGPSANYIHGLVRQHLLMPYKLVKRHDLLVVEIEKRGYKHSTPMDPFEFAFPVKKGYVCPALSTYELWRRCANCRSRITELHARAILRVYGCATDVRCRDRFLRDFEARPTDPATGLALLPAS